LGIVLYEWLTGRLPFEATDALEWAHRHLAVPPLRPRSLDPAIPETVERILLRLLEKDPEDRYQTAEGLAHDLERCLVYWEEARSIPSFALGERDRTDRLSVPQKLYGRERELGVLLSAFAEVTSGRGPRVVLVSGGTGVGKSGLMRELAVPVATAGGFLVSGNFEGPSRVVPYAPIARGMTDLVALMLASREESLVVWRERLQSAVGDNGKVLTDLVPQLEFVLGPQPAVPVLPQAQEHHRFSWVFRRFMGALAGPGHPVVLLVDDLEWGDAASLQVIAELASDSSLSSLLVVGAYRDEPAPSGLLAQMLGRLESSGAPVDHVELGPLSVSDLTELLAEALDMDPRECAPLGDALTEKTGGNPLFFTQLLLDVRTAGLLCFDRDSLIWRWDTERIRERPASANVAELLTERLGACSPDLRSVLSLAACVGGSFDARLLARLSAGKDTFELVDEAVRVGLLTRWGEGYRFSHDSVQEGAYAAIPVGERPSLHLQIGRALQAEGADVFEALRQLDRARSAIGDAAERLELARLNRYAAERARVTAAFGAVSDYCRAGLDLLGPGGWVIDHELAFALTIEGAGAELHAGNLREAERLMSTAIANARTRLEWTVCARLWIDLKGTGGGLVDGLEFVVDVLRRYGLEVDLHPDNVQDVERAMLERLCDRPPEAILELPLGEDPEIEAVLDLVARCGPHAHIVDPRLHRVLACIVVDLTLQHGVFAASPWGLAAYALELSLTERHAEAGRFADAALGLLERHELVASRSFVSILLGKLVGTRAFSAAALIGREGIRAGIEHGDVLSATLCWVGLCYNRLAAGDGLAEIEREAQEGLEFARRVGFVTWAASFLPLRQLVRALRGRTDRPVALTGRVFSEVPLEESPTDHGVSDVRAWFRGLLLQAQVFAGEFDAALATNERLASELLAAQDMRGDGEAALFGALAIAGCDDEVRRSHFVRLREHSKRLEVWASACPENYSHRAALVAGELARAEGREAEALELFAIAIVHAETRGAVHIQALAHESAARLRREQGLDRLAAAHLRAAIECYREWGATAKVARLEQTVALHDPGRSGISGDSLDVLAVVKTSQAISGEIVHERVLERLLETVIADAGARSGLLLLCRHGRTVLAATGERTERGVAVTVHDPPLEPAPDLVPATVVNYVTRTKEPLIVGDARASSPFSADPYLLRRHVRSMLCIPMLSKRDLRGLVVLENDLLAEAFTLQRLPALEVLTSQALISLENASLYAELQHEVTERKRYELELRHEITERERYERELRYLADHDSLTGLLNRRRFREELDRELAHARRLGIPGAVLSIDLDNFKYVNDTLGHSIGDELIAEAGRLLARRLRGTDVLSRIGGDEFAVILPGVTAQEAELVAGALLEALRSELTVELSGGPRPVTASAGIVPFTSASGLGAEELLVQADIAMYDSKESGRDRASVYSPDDDRQERLQARLTWAERIRRALDEARLVLHAQAIVPLDGHPRPCHELLVRMLDDDGQVIRPDVFLPVAERMNLIERIDRWVIAQAIKLLRTEQRAGHDPQLYVNLSAVSVGDHALPEYIARELEHQQADGHGLCFEITETTAITNMNVARWFAARTAELGCRIALDDFGTGFASFYYLKHLPFQYVKIDGEFIQQLASSRTDQLVVKSIADIVHGLGKRTIAEFVSDQGTVQLLKQYGVDYAQGYYISKPVPVAETNLAHQPTLPAVEQS
jgi:diguanylate cyclase (GGDEF)-like protein